MLVEDDKSLREIYSIRLAAEGYAIVSAGDGEEALGVAVQEKVSAGDGRNDAFQNIDESYRASGFLGKASR